MYDSKFVVAIKAGGKILRENKDLVKLPYGSEFTVLVKNLNSRRAKFTLDIDGTDALDGEEIIVNANSEVEMKRFIRNGNMDEGNAFKFIERTTAIEDGPRGIKMDDGIVRVQFWFEQAQPEITYSTTYHNDYYGWGYSEWPYKKTFYHGPFYTSSGITGGITGSLSDVKLGSNSAKGIMRGITKNAVNNVSTTSADVQSWASTSDSATLSSGVDTFHNAVGMNAGQNMAAPTNDIGITVPGSKVDQKFTPIYGFKSEVTSNVIVIRLVGMVGEIEISHPVTVKTKNICSTCSHTNKANAKFCSQCATSLVLL